MGFFSFIESFFFLSLGITFVLIFLMVFHFKQRVEQLEKKSENMLEVCNGLVQQIHGLKTFCISNQTGSSFLPPSSSSSRISENITFSTSSPIPILEENVNVNVNTFQKIVVEDFEDSDSDSDSDEEEEEEEDIDVSDELDSVPVSSLPLDSSSEDFVLKEGIEEGIEEVDMNLLEEETVNVLDSLPIELQEEEQPEEEIQVQPEKEEEENKLEEEIKLEEEEIKSEEEVDIKNLSLQQLRQLVSNKGLSTNPNKMKKQELVQLLQKTSAEPKASTEQKSLQDLALLL